MTLNLESLRLQADKLLTLLLWLHVPAIWIMAQFNGTSAFILTAIGLASALLASTSLWLSPAKGFGRIMIAACLMIQISLGVAALQGHPWQIDMHMYYFALLAFTVAYLDWRVIAAGTGIVAVHHIGLNFLYSEAVYPGGGNIGRLAIHAIILIAEAAILVLVADRGSRIIAALDEKSDLAARAEAESNARTAEAARLVDLMSGALTSLSRKDLSCRITGDIPAAYAQLCSAFNSAIADLESVIGSVVHSTGTISAGSDEISAASNDLSRRTESQAASVEETAAALAEITQKVRETSQGAQQARNAVNQAREEAQYSSTVVAQAVDAINRIETSSSEISKIISVIEEIAFQTNLLALNAGVEAARAGDSGRGFAVVATEVRALAGRSAEAAKNIKDLISNAGAEVVNGVRLVSATGEALSKIVRRISEIADRINEISAAAESQAHGIEEVNTAINHIDQGTQQNAAMVQEATAATASLTVQAEALKGLVEEFRVRSTAKAEQRAA